MYFTDIIAMFHVITQVIYNSSLGDSYNSQFTFSLYFSHAFLIKTLFSIREIYVQFLLSTLRNSVDIERWLLSASVHNYEWQTNAAYRPLAANTSTSTGVRGSCV